MKYLNGFGNHFETEAQKNSLPRGQNSPKKSPLGLIPEQISGTAFTMERHKNLRSWLYRIHPSASHGEYEVFHQKHWQTKVSQSQNIPPSRMRWGKPAQPTEDMDFIQGVKTMVATFEKPGGAVHQYHFNKPMGTGFFYNADGEMIFVPEKSSIELRTEMGILEISPQEIGVIPRGIKFQVNPLSEGWHRGYLGENMGQPLTLPNLGPLGANALANPRHFQYPVAFFEDKRVECEIVAKFSHGFWKYTQDHSPLDVVAWQGNYAPYKYDLKKFNTMGTVSYDHPDPCIYTVLTSPSNTPGTANMDFVIFPPRWLVAENSFRPPYYHRNIMSEYMGLVHGTYDAKQEGFVPGGSSLHNSMSAHGPDVGSFLEGISSDESPKKIKDTMAFMFETCHIFHPTRYALESPHRQKDYPKCWEGFRPLYEGEV